jgi:hypothetical protein
MEYCIICFEEYTANIMPIILNCNHKLCLICYEKILNTKNNVLCPICRNLIEKEIIINLPRIVRTISEPESTIRRNIILIFCTIIIILILLYVIL